MKNSRMMTACLALAAALATAGCGDTGGETSSGGTTGSTGSGESCGQSCQDDMVAFGIDNTWWLINNEDIAGKNSGAQNMTAPCPSGGTVTITGSDSVDSNQLESLQLSLDLQSCANPGNGFTLTFDGTMTVNGTFETNSGTTPEPNAVTMASDSLSIKGTLTSPVDTSVSESCAISLTDTYEKNGSQQGWLNGLVCGRKAGD